MVGCFIIREIKLANGEEMINHKLKDALGNEIGYVVSFWLGNIRVNVLANDRLSAISMAIEYYVKSK